MFPPTTARRKARKRPTVWVRSMFATALASVWLAGCAGQPPAERTSGAAAGLETGREASEARPETYANSHANLPEPRRTPDAALRQPEDRVEFGEPVADDAGARPSRG